VGSRKEKITNIVCNTKRNERKNKIIDEEKHEGMEGVIMR